MREVRDAMAGILDNVTLAQVCQRVDEARTAADVAGEGALMYLHLRWSGARFRTLSLTQDRFSHRLIVNIICHPNGNCEFVPCWFGDGKFIVVLLRIG